MLNDPGITAFSPVPTEKGKTGAMPPNIFVTTPKCLTFLAYSLSKFLIIYITFFHSHFYLFLFISFYFTRNQLKITKVQIEIKIVNKKTATKRNILEHGRVVKAPGS